MELLPPDHLAAYRAQLTVPLDEGLAEVREAVNGGTGQLLRLYESAVFSSQIEGSKVTLNIFKQTMEAAGTKPKPREVQEVHDLVLAYQFAQGHPLNMANLLQAHRILAALLVHGNDQGAWRTKGVKVGNAFVTVYMAPHQQLVPGLMEQLMRETDALLQRELAVDEVFHYAALLHLVFAKVHPFMDGNGRTARLLEKWFLAHHLGPLAWSIRSEQVYIRDLDRYYDTLADLGPAWGSLLWEKCVPFLLMLPGALRNK